MTDADEDADAQLGDATEPESLSEAIRYAILDDLEGATQSDEYR